MQKMQLSVVINRAKSGKIDDVNYLMDNLSVNETVAVCKLVDFGLSQIETAEGKDRIRHYLFNGTPIQRSYAGLYFKRRGDKSTIDKAVAQSCIDTELAYSR